LRFFGEIEKAAFVSRPNRFVVECLLDGNKAKASLPNPGRLWELFFPGVTLYLEKALNMETKYRHKVVAVDRDGSPIVLHTHKSNDIVISLLEKRLIPGLEDAKLIGSEVKRGGSRFDLLLEKGGQKFLAEIKSCTLFGRNIAMFPDAPSLRGKRHVEELAELKSGNNKNVVLFLIHRPGIKCFIPDYHTDPRFSDTLHSLRNEIDIIPLTIRWNPDLSLSNKVKRVDIPWQIVERESGNRGTYLVILKLDEKKEIAVGKLSKIPFREGYYVYIGSALNNLDKRVERHKRWRKRLRWHIDYLRAESTFHNSIAIRSGDRLECDIAREMKKIGEWEAPGFGCSDCFCSSHLFGIKTDPLMSRSFIDMIQYYRIDRLEK